MDLVILTVIAKKTPMASSNAPATTPNTMRECITLRRLVSWILVTTARMVALTSAAIDAERVETSADSSTTEVSSSI